jgi:hypothetical protein
MPRRPEIGNIQLYPNRPLQRSDKNGYVLKFYCPIRQKRVRKNCGTRDRREARKILRECRERLLNGDDMASGGGITAEQALVSPTPLFPSGRENDDNKSWQECFEKYRMNRKSRIRNGSFEDAMSRINIAERIFEKSRGNCGLEDSLEPTG